MSTHTDYQSEKVKILNPSMAGGVAVLQQGMHHFARKILNRMACKVVSRRPVSVRESLARETTCKVSQSLVPLARLTSVKRLAHQTSKSPD